MRCDTWKVNSKNAVQAQLDLYIQDTYPDRMAMEERPLVLVCPGGGYEHVSVREGEPVALQFLAAGYHSAVLRYDVAEHGVAFPCQLTELAASVAYLREHAKEYHIAADKILVCGFSAGGHLAASLGCFWQEEWLEKEMGTDKKWYRPNGLILAYPVITSGEFAHEGSFIHVTGNIPGKTDAPVWDSGLAVKEFLSLEHRVTDMVPPVFMWHTFEDESVPLENSLMFANSLRKAGVSLEYHVFPRGGHGYSLANLQTATPNLQEIEPQCEQWMDLCKKWITYSFGD